MLFHEFVCHFMQLSTLVNYCIYKKLRNRCKNVFLHLCTTSFWMD